ncbi:MAG: ATP-binding protein [Aestuariivita sp.]|nr:ATP-binding protein [Aestuariivita sp.]
MNGFEVTSNNPPIIAETVGSATGQIPVEIGSQFLQQFSEQLYSSPQKAFEELISNGWDAGATFVDVKIPADLAAPTATLTVFDNGCSMDADGLHALWKVAFSPKKNKRTHHGRQVIGKFGLGKLSTYVLADHLTYICKAEDGTIRRVTMNYGSINENADSDKLLSNIALDLYELTADDLSKALASVDPSGELMKLINEGPPPPEQDTSTVDEFGSITSNPVLPPTGTWTLVILSELKQTGRDLKAGHLKRMLKTALPISSTITIRLNDQVLRSSKLDAEVEKSWKISSDLGFTEFTALRREGEDEEDIKFTVDQRSCNGTKCEFIDIPGIGPVTGTITLYRDKISGGKAEERGFSNGFLVNVLGRVVNQEDSFFGSDNLNHAAWARFRMAVRADGLDNFLTINRQQFRDDRALRVFRAFLRRCFNLARTEYNSDKNAEMPDGGDVLIKSVGPISLVPLRSAVTHALKNGPQLPGLFDETGITDREKSRADWHRNTANNITNTLQSVKYESLDGNEFVQFRLADNSIVINKKHPFVAEHFRGHAEKKLLRSVAMVNFLSDIYALEDGVVPKKLEDMRRYRDRLMRFHAMKDRQSGIHIAQILLATQHKSNAPGEMETVLAEALRYLGYNVDEKGGPGEPEGIASALLYSSSYAPSDDDPHPPLYKFTFDAKSTKYKQTKTGNLGLDGIQEHKERYSTDYALVVATDFGGSAVVTRCEQHGITPVRASDIGKLLEYTVEYGAIPLNKLVPMFKLRNPVEVSNWVNDLKADLEANRELTIDIFLKALKHLQGKVPDFLSAGLVSFTCRETLNAKTVQESDVLSLARGLAILVPDLIDLTDSEKIVVSAPPDRVAAAINSQLESLHESSEGPSAS